MYHLDSDKKNMTVLSRIAHQERGAYYYNQCCSDRAYERVVLPENEIYFLEHYYREDKRTPGWKRMVVRAKSISKQSYEKDCCIVYSGKSVCRDEEVEILAHWNASKPDPRSYICTSSKVSRQEEELLSSNPGNFLVWYKFSTYSEFSFIKLFMYPPILFVFA